MPRIRTIKPEFWQNETLAGLSEHARLLAIALLNHCDDSGLFLANPSLVRAACFPFDEHSKNVLGSIQDLSRIGYIEVRDCDGKQIGKVCKFRDHQRIDKPQKSKLSAIFDDFPSENDNSRNVPGMFLERSEIGPRLERKGTGKGKEQGKETNAANESPRECEPKPKPEAYHEEFEAFWSAYPVNRNGRKRGKRECFALWRRVAAEDRGKLEQAARNYAAEESEYVKDPVRFLKLDFWRDYVGEPETAKPATSRALTIDQLSSITTSDLSK